MLSPFLSPPLPLAGAVPPRRPLPRPLLLDDCCCLPGLC
jgi:hypothetical protein